MLSHILYRASIDREGSSTVLCCLFFLAARLAGHTFGLLNEAPPAPYIRGGFPICLVGYGTTYWTSEPFHFAPLLFDDSKLGVCSSVTGCVRSKVGLQTHLNSVSDGGGYLA